MQQGPDHFYCFNTRSWEYFNHIHYIQRMHANSIVKGSQFFKRHSKAYGLVSAFGWFPAACVKCSHLPLPHFDNKFI